MKSALSKTLQNLWKSSVILQKKGIFFSGFAFFRDSFAEKKKNYKFMYINVDSFGVGKETQSLKSQNTTYECMILNSIFVLSRLVRIIID